MKFLVTALVVALTGCSTLFGDRFRDRADDYLDTEQQDAAVDLDGQPLATGNALVIPALPQDPGQPERFELPMPAPLQPSDVDQESQVASLNALSQIELNPRLERDGSGSLILRLDGGYALAWAEVTEAIAASSLTMTDLNRSLGSWYLRLRDPEAVESRGWWSRLWSSDEDSQAKTYLLKLNRAHNGVYVSLLSEVDELAGEAMTQDVLEQVLQQLES